MQARSLTTCVAGQYVSGGGCSPCPLGTYSNTVNAASCYLCPLGTYASSTGTTACSLCGLFNPVGAQAGQTTAVLGATTLNASVCNFGYWGYAVSEGGCYLCSAYAGTGRASPTLNTHSSSLCTGKSDFKTT